MLCYLVQDALAVPVGTLKLARPSGPSCRALRPFRRPAEQEQTTTRKELTLYFDRDLAQLEAPAS